MLFGKSQFPPSRGRDSGHWLASGGTAPRPNRSTNFPWQSGVTGHTPKSIDTIIERYLVRTAKLAARAFAKRLESEAE